MANSDAPPAWTVIEQREDIQPGPTGAVRNGVVVTFRTDAGAIGSVFVPEDEYKDPAHVKELLQARADTMRAVSQLQG